MVRPMIVPSKPKSIGFKSSPLRLATHKDVSDNQCVIVLMERQIGEDGLYGPISKLTSVPKHFGLNFADASG